MTDGSLEIILGPMFSGKTTRLIQLYQKYTQLNVNVIAVNYASDTRYHDNMLSTHDKQMIPCIQCMNLADILHNDSIVNSSVVLINEGQFFPDIYNITLELVEKHNKTVIICGLDGDFKRVKFGDLLDLLPFCDTVTKLHAKCLCGKKAIFSHRITNEMAQIVIGSSNYTPLCRGCYMNTNKSVEVKVSNCSC
jgi:thymidine kinase